MDVVDMDWDVGVVTGARVVSFSSDKCMVVLGVGCRRAKLSCGETTAVTGIVESGHRGDQILPYIDITWLVSSRSEPLKKKSTLGVRYCYRCPLGSGHPSGRRTQTSTSTRPAISEEGPNYAQATTTRPYHLMSPQSRNGNTTTSVIESSDNNDNVKAKIRLLNSRQQTSQPSNHTTTSTTMS
jgi:hypothetical protein